MQISVIIPIYNAENSICRCVETVINQTTKAFQIILVDDGSTDHTPILLNKYHSIPNVLIIHKENGGEGSARNVGLDHVSPEADFVAFVDSDDWVRPTWLQDFVDNWNGEDVLFQNALWLKGEDMMLERKVTLDHSKPFIEKVHHLFIHNSIGYVWAGIWRASIIRERHIRFNKYRMWVDAVFSAEFLLYAEHIDIIPNDRCHEYGYVYQYPTTLRSYTNPNALLIEGYVARFNLLHQLYILHQGEHLFAEVNNHISQSIISVMISAYKCKIEKNERKLMINEIRKMDEKMHLIKASVKVHLYCFFINHLENPDRVLKFIQ